jgi:hypothetical protein
MTKPTIDEIRPLIIKHWNEFGKSGSFKLAKMKNVYPDDYAKIKAYQGDSNSVVSSLIANMKAKNLLPPAETASQVPAVITAKPTLQEIQQAVAFLLVEIPSLAKSFDKAKIMEKHPEIWQKFQSYYGDDKASLYAVFATQRNRIRNVKNVTQIKTREREPEMTPAPAMALNFCPHCAFPIGSIIKAANAMATLGR